MGLWRFQKTAWHFHFGSVFGAEFLFDGGGWWGGGIVKIEISDRASRYALYLKNVFFGVWSMLLKRASARALLELHSVSLHKQRIKCIGQNITGTRSRMLAASQLWSNKSNVLYCTMSLIIRFGSLISNLLQLSRLPPLVLGAETRGEAPLQEVTAACTEHCGVVAWLKKSTNRMLAALQLWSNKSNVLCLLSVIYHHVWLSNIKTLLALTI